MAQRRQRGPERPTRPEPATTLPAQRAAQGQPAAPRQRLSNGRFAQDQNADLRAKQALDLKLQGWTWGRIAEACGYSSRANAYNAANKLLRREIHGSTRHYRRVQVARIEGLMEAVYAILTVEKANADGEPVLTTNLWAVDRLTALMDRQARLLGLDIKNEGGDTLQAPIIREYPQGLTEAV